MHIFLKLPLLLALLLPAAAASADQLNWDAVSQTNGSLNNTYTVGNTLVNVVISGATAALTTTTAGGTINAPAITADYTGGLTGQNSLTLAADFADNASSITVTVSFKSLDGATPRTVSSVNFDLFDVDLGAGSFVDQVRNIQAMLGLAVTQPQGVTGTAGGNVVTGSAATSFTVTGTAPIDNATGGANVTVNFGTQALSSFSFTYGNATTAPGDPNRQAIALHDINFIPVPEPSSAVFLVAGLAAGALVIARRRRATV